MLKRPSLILQRKLSSNTFKSHTNLTTPNVHIIIRSLKGHSLGLVYVHVGMFTAYRYMAWGFMLAYFQQYFIIVPESDEYKKIQIMQSLNEPKTGQTQMLDIFAILVLSTREYFASLQLH